MSRFLSGPPWRFITVFLDAAGGSSPIAPTLTNLDRLARNRQVVINLTSDASVGQPSSASFDLPSDDGRVNGLYLDGAPFVSEGIRLLYAFRRDGSPSVPWTCRFGGIIQQITDSATADQSGSGNPVTSVTAFDPWQLLAARPVRDDDGSLPPAGGLLFRGPHRGSDIAKALLERTILYDGACHIDPDGGTIEDTAFLTNVTFQQGLSVADAWRQLGATGLPADGSIPATTMDILLDPIYDPVLRPGITSGLSIYVLAGSQRNNAIFAWDRPGDSLVGLTRDIDGTQRVNELQWYTGQGGPPVLVQSDPASISEYGEYWGQQSFPGQVAAVVEPAAERQLLMVKDGRRTFTISPSPERSPSPFTGYYLGDRCPVYASRRFRQKLATPLRVLSIPVAISDDAMETVTSMTVTPDGF